MLLNGFATPFFPLKDGPELEAQKYGGLLGAQGHVRWASKALQDSSVTDAQPTMCIMHSAFGAVRLTSRARCGAGGVGHNATGACAVDQHDRAWYEGLEAPKHRGLLGAQGHV